MLVPILVSFCSFMVEYVITCAGECGIRSLCMYRVGTYKGLYFKRARPTYTSTCNALMIGRPATMHAQHHPQSRNL